MLRARLCGGSVGYATMAAARSVRVGRPRKYRTVITEPISMRIITVTQLHSLRQA